MSSASLLETSIVVNGKKGAAGLEILREFMALAEIQVADFTDGQARLALEAHLRFGKGMGHPAQLNIPGCCTYALAAETGEPVFFKGADFGKTDIPPSKDSRVKSLSSGLQRDCHGLSSFSSLFSTLRVKREGDSPDAQSALWAVIAGWLAVYRGLAARTSCCLRGQESRRGPAACCRCL